MCFTQTHLSGQCEVRLPLATQMHRPIEHYRRELDASY